MRERGADEAPRYSFVWRFFSAPHGGDIALFVHSSVSGRSFCGGAVGRRPQAKRSKNPADRPPPCSEATSRKGLAPLGGPFKAKPGRSLRETDCGAAHSSRNHAGRDPVPREERYGE